MFMVSLFTVVKWKKKTTKDLLVNAWINEIWHNLLAITKNVELIHTLTCMHFENTMLNKSVTNVHILLDSRGGSK